MRAPVIRAVRRLATRFRRDESGLALTEFALAAPLVLTVGAYGTEMCNLAMMNLRVSQYTMDLADNASRMGNAGGLSTYTVDESDINNALQGIRLEGQKIGLTTYGRVTLSSLEGSTSNGNLVQTLHWQRCVGAANAANYQSSYGTAGSSTSGTVIASTGMGDTGYKVVAPSGSGVMFVEVNYLYQPLFGNMFVTSRRIHYVSSFLVRDSARSYSSGVSNTSSQTASSCSSYSS